MLRSQNGWTGSQWGETFKELGEKRREIAPILDWDLSFSKIFLKVINELQKVLKELNLMMKRLQSYQSLVILTY